LAAPTRRLGHPARTLWNWVRSHLHLIAQTYHVLDFMYLHRLENCALEPGHPWLTGLSPHTGEPIWPANIVYASPRRAAWHPPAPDPDAEIVTKIGVFLTRMMARSAVDPEIPQGPARRMPHAVNLLHGPVHYNGGYLLFDDFEDTMRHFSDPAFVAEMRRFARQERRELTVVTRERHFDPEEFAWLVCFVRARLPWYANGNGPTKKRVLWGTPSPYAAINPINGSWVRDLERFLASGVADVRPPIDISLYFRAAYQGDTVEYSFLERFHAWAQYRIIRLKGFQGNLVFTGRKRIEPQNLATYRESGGDWSSSYRVSHPFAPIERVRAMRRATNAASRPSPRM
jgi:hypothetical protein